MAQVIIKTFTGKDKIEALINKIYTICKNDSNLSPRFKKELINAYNKNNLLVATAETKTVGWLLKIPYNQNFQELACGYVIKSYRSKGVFKQLLNAALISAPISTIVTFNYNLSNYLINKIGFKKSSLWEAIKLSKGKFLFNRLNFQRLTAIKNHYRKGKPIYTIYHS